MLPKTDLNCRVGGALAFGTAVTGLILCQIKPNNNNWFSRFSNWALNIENK